MKVSLFGIQTCDKVRHARKWLEVNSVDYDYIDFKSVEIKKIGVDCWLKNLGWKRLINKKSLTWKSLSKNITTCVVDNESALKVMCKFPLIIKRPVMVYGQLTLVGFSENDYQEILNKKNLKKNSSFY